MKAFAQPVLTISLAAALLAGCGGSQPPIGAPGAMTQQASALAARTGSSNYRVVYSFGPPPDGGCPTASLIDVGGKLYGTTSEGGAYNPYNCGNGPLGPGGTLFSVTTGGKEKVLHSFGRQTDGANPQAAVIDVDGTLYGTTVGSHPGYGTVFSSTLSGTEKVLHTFNGVPDGAYLFASVIKVKGELYGTTSEGGEHDRGMFFSLTTGGTEKVLHNFKGRQGSYVYAGLVDVDGKFYGTASGGGKYHSGVVFRITLGGREKVLHSFGSGSDGNLPSASLIGVNGTLYGTTELGGTYGYGTVFSITPSGTEQVLHSFGNGTDGAVPEASLIDVNGTFYGTTIYGGAYDNCGGIPRGCGTVFSIISDGTEKVLHSFGNGADGAFPAASLVDVDGTLYGTTTFGSASGYLHNGTVFALTP